VTTSLASVSIGIYALGTVLADYRVGGDFGDWTTWYPIVMVRAAGPFGLLVTASVLLAVLFAIRDTVRNTVRASEIDASVTLGGECGLELEQPRQ